MTVTYPFRIDQHGPILSALGSLGRISGRARWLWSTQRTHRTPPMERGDRSPPGLGLRQSLGALEWGTKTFGIRAAGTLADDATQRSQSRGDGRGHRLELLVVPPLGIPEQEGVNEGKVSGPRVWAGCPATRLADWNVRPPGGGLRDNPPTSALAPWSGWPTPRPAASRPSRPGRRAPRGRAGCPSCRSATSTGCRGC